MYISIPSISARVMLGDGMIIYSTCAWMKATVVKNKRTVIWSCEKSIIPKGHPNSFEVTSITKEREDPKQR